MSRTKYIEKGNTEPDDNIYIILGWMCIFSVVGIIKTIGWIIQLIIWLSQLIPMPHFTHGLK